MYRDHCREALRVQPRPLAHFLGGGLRCCLQRSLIIGLWLMALAPALSSAQPGSHSQSFPPLTGRVVDQADLLSPSEETILSAQLKAHEDQTSNQVVVVTIASLEGQPISDYGYQLGRHWQIGQAGKNNGVILLVSVGDRQMRIEVGYGLEGALSDGIASDIIQHYITPAFKQGNFSGGIQSGVSHIIEAIDGEYKVIGNRSKTKPVDDPLLFVMSLFFGLPVLITVVRLLRGEKDFIDTKNMSDNTVPALMFGGMTGFFIWVATHLWWFAALFGLFVGLNILVSKTVKVDSGRYGGYGGGGFGGGGFGGGRPGGFSGGGGSFGGGGASGGW